MHREIDRSSSAEECQRFIGDRFQQQCELLECSARKKMNIFDDQHCRAKTAEAAKRSDHRRESLFRLLPEQLPTGLTPPEGTGQWRSDRCSRFGIELQMGNCSSLLFDSRDCFLYQPALADS